VLNNLFKRTALQQSFAGNMMAVLGGGRMPEQLTLRRALLEFIEFRVECVQRRTAFELKKAETRLHLVEGLLVALARLDEVVDAIRQARTSLALALAPALALALALALAPALALALTLALAIRQARGAAEARTLLESAAFGLSTEQASP